MFCPNEERELNGHASFLGLLFDNSDRKGLASLSQTFRSIFQCFPESEQVDTMISLMKEAETYLISVRQIHFLRHSIQTS